MALESQVPPHTGRRVLQTWATAFALPQRKWTGPGRQLDFCWLATSPEGKSARIFWQSRHEMHKGPR